MSEKTTKDRLKETEKLEAEIKRSLSVVGVKEAHKKIEDIEPLKIENVRDIHAKTCGGLLGSSKVVNMFLNI